MMMDGRKLESWKAGKPGKLESQIQKTGKQIQKKKNYYRSKS